MPEHSPERQAAANPARADMLSRLRRQVIFPRPLPDVLQGEWIEFENPVEKFAAMVESVGGSCRVLGSGEELLQRLQELEPWRTAGRIFSAVDQVPGNVDLEDIEDPHLLEDLDFVVYPGEFAVAENGAVWVTDRGLKHRVIFFITQFLVLVVPRDQIVHNMHQAYARIDIPRPGFGLFLSGPSKTADIEQSLVIGAHGCRQLQVYLV